MKQYYSDTLKDTFSCNQDKCADLWSMGASVINYLNLDVSRDEQIVKIWSNLLRSNIVWKFWAYLNFLILA